MLVTEIVLETKWNRDVGAIILMLRQLISDLETAYKGGFAWMDEDPFPARMLFRLTQEEDHGQFGSHLDHDTMQSVCNLDYRPYSLVYHIEDQTLPKKTKKWLRENGYQLIGDLVRVPIPESADTTVEIIRGEVKKLLESFNLFPGQILIPVIERWYQLRKR